MKSGRVESKWCSPTLLTRIARVILFYLTALSTAGYASHAVVLETFSSDHKQWEAIGESIAEVINEPGGENQVLQLTPRQKALSYVLFDTKSPMASFEMTGRVLFPTEGDGYVGFVYSYRSDQGRVDYGCVYLKSNGSYVRFSPHFDGNPSWRLFEELRVDLLGERRIQVGQWYRFLLSVNPKRVDLYIDNFDSPVFTTDVIDNPAGRVGMEARPGGGEPVWVDDIVINETGRPGDPAEISDKAHREPDTMSEWLVYDAPLSVGVIENLPTLPDTGAWLPATRDKRGAIITATRAGHSGLSDNDVLVKTRFDFNRLRSSSQAVLKISTTNEMQLWLNDLLIGSVDRDAYIWSDHTTNELHAGSTLPIEPVSGSNELVILMKGGEFAGGGFFVDIQADSKNAD